ncbi:MAG: CYTH domain-containing protein [Spirochaetaceae bacterium]|nr:CYTH domain-containing protein [Spirochaetaceae bacterium]
MSIEIEVKARVSDSESVKKRIPAGAVYLGPYEKSDQYWLIPPEYGAGPNFPSGIRVRKEKKSPEEPLTRCLVCFKIKERRDAIEVNDEKEFEVSDAALFTELLERLALVKGQGKTKTGWAWEYEGITIELSLVAGLGWFVELEILAPAAGEEAVEAGRKRLLALLNTLGITEDKIERRYYTEMLREC